MADQEADKKEKPDQPSVNGDAPATPVSKLPLKVGVSDASSSIVEESMILLDLKSSVPATTFSASLETEEPFGPFDVSSSYRLRQSMDLPCDSPLAKPNSMRIRPPTLDYKKDSKSVSVRLPQFVPRFPRVDFDDRLAELADDRKPAWKTWEESIKESYHKAKRTVERSRDETEFLEFALNRTRKSRAEGPLSHLGTSIGFFPGTRSETSITIPSLSDRSNSASASSGHAIAVSSGSYAAPAVSSTSGTGSRYERRANDVEAMLLKTAPLPAHMKVITAKEFRNAPAPSTGSASELDDYDFSRYCPKPYYSRPNRDDPDYFDFDLQHSVDLFKRPEGRFTPRGPQEWETKLLGEMSLKGAAPVSGYMFTKGDPDWRTNGSSYLSAALRTPKFWEQRFENLGKQVRDNNPISLDSINRNRPVPSRFTEYVDPDFEDYEDPRLDD